MILQETEPTFWKITSHQRQPIKIRCQFDCLRERRLSAHIYVKAHIYTILSKAQEAFKAKTGSESIWKFPLPFTSADFLHHKPICQRNLQGSFHTHCIPSMWAYYAAKYKQDVISICPLLDELRLSSPITSGLRT
jgi:hypothetical protein